MTIRELLAAQLARLIAERGRPASQTAEDLGYSRQRLHQLKTAHRTAGTDAIEEAINKLGYEVDGVNIKPRGEESQ